MHFLEVHMLHTLAGCGSPIVVVHQHLFQYIDSLRYSQMLILRSYVTLQGSFLVFAQNSLISYIHFHIVCLDVIVKLFCSESASNLFELIVIVASLEERLLQEYL